MTHTLVSHGAVPAPTHTSACTHAHTCLLARAPQDKTRNTRTHPHTHTRTHTHTPACSDTVRGVAAMHLYGDLARVFFVCLSQNFNGYHLPIIHNSLRRVPAVSHTPYFMTKNNAALIHAYAHVCSRLLVRMYARACVYSHRSM